MPCRTPISAENAEELVEFVSGRGSVQRLCHVDRPLRRARCPGATRPCRRCQSSGNAPVILATYASLVAFGGAKNASPWAPPPLQRPSRLSDFGGCPARRRSPAHCGSHIPGDFFVAPVRIAHGGASCIRLVSAHSNRPLPPSAHRPVRSHSSSVSGFTTAAGSALPPSGQRC